MKKKILIGCDPELFVFSGDTPVSAHDLLPGTKHNPCTVPKGAVQVDGVAAEFNITPASTGREFVASIRNVVRILDKMVKVKNPNFVLRAVPSVTFDKDYFANLPADAKALGCEPDYNAYTLDVNKKPETTKPFRTGSGHIHIGWEGCNQDDLSYIDTCTGLVKELDFGLYRQSLAWDSDETRMELYGQPGAFRFKPYGLEYRVLSNRWLINEGLTRFVYDATKNITARYLAGERFSALFDKQEKTLTEFLAAKRLPVVQDYYKEV
jgi:hypothetical protein